MALQPDIQYVPYYYVDGSTARKVQGKTVHNHTAKPVSKPNRAKRKVIAVDPAAIVGIVVAVILLCSLVSGFVEYRQCLEQNRMMSDYVTSLQLENVQLQQQYRENVDLDYIREVADAIGMVPTEDVQQIQIQVQPPQEDTVEMGFWESFTTFLAGLFA